MKLVKRFGSLLLALVMLVGLCACTGSGTAAPSTDNTQQSTQSSTGTGSNAAAPSTSDSNEPAANQPAAETDDKKGGDLVIIDTAEVTHIAWYQLQSFNDRFQFSLTAYEMLFHYDNQGGVVPFLAEGYVPDPENRTYTITLRKGIKFHDGSELNADSAVWTLQNYKELGIKSAAFFSNVESIEKTGDYEFVIHLSQWDATIPYSLARECGIMVSKEAANGDPNWYLENVCGTGPFKLDSWERDVSKTFVRFDDYWQGTPNLDSVTVKIYGDTTVAAGDLELGNAQVLYCTDYKLVDELTAEGMIACLGMPSQIALLNFNCTDEEYNGVVNPFYDVRVRQAVCYGIDKEGLLNGVYSNYGMVTNQFAPQGSVFYSEDVKGYPYDPAKAKELLAEAGYPNGFETTCIVRNDVMQVKCVTAIQDMMKEIGIDMKVDVQETGDFSANLSGWHTGLFFHTSSLPIDVTTQMSSMFKQGLSGIVLGLTSLLRPDNLNDAIVAACSSTTPEDAAANIRKAQGIMIDEICDLDPIVTVYQPIIKSAKLHDDGLNAVEYTTATLWKAWLEK